MRGGGRRRRKTNDHALTAPAPTHLLQAGAAGGVCARGLGPHVGGALRHVGAFGPRCAADRGSKPGGPRGSRCGRSGRRRRRRRAGPCGRLHRHPEADGRVQPGVGGQGPDPGLPGARLLPAHRIRNQGGRGACRAGCWLLQGTRRRVQSHARSRGRRAPAARQLSSPPSSLLSTPLNASPLHSTGD